MKKHPADYLPHASPEFLPQTFFSKEMEEEVRGGLRNWRENKTYWGEGHLRCFLCCTLAKNLQSFLL